MYNFRCRTRIAGGFMIRDYVANQSKDNNKKESHRLSFYYFCLQTWLPTVQLVLQADWQEVWHSPQPPVLAVFCRDSVLIVRIRLAMIILLNTYCINIILS